MEKKINLGKVKGLSAYEIALKNGFNGTEQEWLESLKSKSVDLSNGIETTGKIHTTKDIVSDYGVICGYLMLGGCTLKLVQDYSNNTNIKLILTDRNSDEHEIQLVNKEPSLERP